MQASFDILLETQTHRLKLNVSYMALNEGSRCYPSKENFKSDDCDLLQRKLGYEPITRRKIQLTELFVNLSNMVFLCILSKV